MCERAPNHTHLELSFEPGGTVHGWGLWRRPSASRPYATYATHAAYAPATAELLSRVLRGLKELV